MEVGNEMEIFTLTKYNNCQWREEGNHCYWWLLGIFSPRHNCVFMRNGTYPLMFIGRVYIYIYIYCYVPLLCLGDILNILIFFALGNIAEEVHKWIKIYNLSYLPELACKGYYTDNNKKKVLTTGWGIITQKQHIRMTS